MKNTRWLFLAAGLVILASIIFTFTGNEAVLSYTEVITRQRTEKDNHFINDQDSPLSEEDKSQFPGLQYFPIDETFKVTAELTRFNDNQIVIMPTSDGKEKNYLKYAIAHFNLHGEELKLNIYQPEDEEKSWLFLPFADATSANTTYGSGRYLDFEIPEDDELIIDFNLAYNPYCAYSENYSCPFPPKENLLQVAIEAGEKNYVK